MENDKFNISFLISNGFKPFIRDKSENVVDLYEIYSNEAILIRLCKSETFESVDVAAMQDVIRWMDLLLIRAMIMNEENFDTAISIVEYNEFLEGHLLDIANLLNKDSYESTTVRIEQMELKRVKPMFP